MINKDTNTPPTDAEEHFKRGREYASVVQDYDQAVKWLTKSANQGNSCAQAYLDDMISRDT